MTNFHNADRFNQISRLRTQCLVPQRSVGDVHMTFSDHEGGLLGYISDWKRCSRCLVLHRTRPRLSTFIHNGWCWVGQGITKHAELAACIFRVSQGSQSLEGCGIWAIYEEKIPPQILPAPYFPRFISNPHPRRDDTLSTLRKSEIKTAASRDKADTRTNNYSQMLGRIPGSRNAICNISITSSKAKRKREKAS